jgi:protein TonB
MKPKKNPKISLEKYRFVFFETGAVLALLIILVAFEWTSGLAQDDNSHYQIKERGADQTEMLNTFQKQKREKAPPELVTIINEVDDNVDIDEPQFWDPEASDENISKLDYRDFERPEEFEDEPVDFILVEEKPLFNGGDPMIEFRRFIAMNLEYPREAIDNGVSGRVTVSFIIDVHGNLTDIRVLDSPHPVLTRAAVEVLESSPLWTPGRQRTKAVPVRFYFPVVFKLN